MSSSALMRRVLTLLKEGAISRSAAVSLLEAAREAGPEPAPSNGRGAGAPIAIIGLAARMPLADTADDFWKLLWNGVDCIRDLPSARVPDAEAHYAGLDEGEFLPGGRFWKLGYLEAIDRFDAAYFGIGRAEAALMDPAHRLFLEVSVEAFEDAGYHGRALQGSRTAVITGNPGYHYAEAVLDEPSATAVTGNVPEFLASRVAYLHDLTGPALGVQSTCASSLVAVHQACQWLRAGACDLALAGGATVFSFPGNVRSNPITASGITSEGQRCRPFARGADGIGRGEGIIAFVLKPLARALADGDAVRAVIRGGAINNDGRCAGLTAPNPRAHTALLLEAWRDAGVDPRALRYIEAHGTGTALGDPIEIKGITDAFASFTSVRQFCGVGAVKGNIGHLVDGAAGASGLLKLVLMLEHRALPPTIHFDEPNEQINFVESPVYVVDRPAPWPREDVPRLGGVSAFGFNGTNCHLVVEEAPESAARRERDAGRAEVLCLSARNDEALRALAGRLADRLEAEPGLPLDDVAHTLAVGRAVHDARLALVASDVPAAARALRGMLEPGAWRSRPEAGIWLGGSVPAPAAAPEAVIRPGDVPAAAQETDPLRAAARRFAISGEVTAREAQPGRPPRRVHLPTYPFQRERHWMRSRARGSRAPGATARAAPGEEVEAIWREVLGDGAGDDFYTSGGNSLLAGLVVSRIGARLGVEVPLSAFLGAPTRAALLGHVESRLQAPASRASQIPPIARGGDLPLSFAQERLWLLERLAPGSVAYNLPGTVRLRGRVDPAALSAALDAVVRRHEVLRAAFPSVDGRPTQVIHPEPQGRLEVLDLRADPDREAVARRRLAEVVQRPFDLERGPLLRAALARLGEDESLLHVDVHHLVADGWSLALLIREVATAYQALAAGKPPPWTTLPIQYADYAVWQRRALGPEALAGPLERCRERLEGAPDLLDLPTDFPRPRVESDRGAQHPIRLSRELVERLQRLARGEGATLYMVLLAAFELLLHRYAGQPDVLVGTPVAGRTRPELEPLVGCFVNTVVLRGRFEGDPTGRELLRRVREDALEAFDQGEVPFEKLVEALRLKRAASHAPLVQVMFALQNVPPAPMSAAGVSFQPVPREVEAVQFDLQLELVEVENGGVEGALEYRTDLFRPRTAARMVRCLETLLEGLAANPDRLVASLPLVDGEDREALLRMSVGPRAPLPAVRSAWELVSARAREAPGRTALQVGAERLTYAELETASSRLAGHLRPRVSRSAPLVGLLLDRGPLFVAAVLATWKAGGAYVPLGADLPVSRLGDMLQDAGCRVLVTTSARWPAGLEERFAGGVLRLDHLGAPPPGLLPGPGSLEDLAYVLFTSGSTGRPKGAMVEQAGMLNHLAAKIELLGLDEHARVAQNAPHTFDISVWQMLAALATGGTTVLYPEEVARDPAALLGRVVEDGITALEVVPSLLSPMLDELERRRMELPALRHLLVTGEAVVPALVRRWLRLYPSIPVINAYGPTEASDDVAHHVMTAPPEGEITPIGRPIRNTRLYVTSAGGQLCPVGVPGELWVSGVCVGRGYVGDEARTRAAFGVDPFDPEAPRLYRTGDQARWLEEGVLEFLGRRDAQVKVRGHRIELAEIESALARDPAVKDAAVLAEPDGRGEKRLVAFLVPVPGGPRGAALAEAARSRLRERLPEYMVPGLVVELDALPLTPNGKVDRRALAALDAPREGVRPNFEAPEGELESRMARAFADVLGVERVGRHDNFFEVGGDSLLVIQTVSRLAREGLLATPALMLQHQTVAELALHVRPMPPGALPAPRPHGSAPFNPIQAWLFEQRFEEMHHWNQCVLVEAVRARLDEGTLRRALEAIHDHHDALRLRYTDEGGRVRQAYDEAARPELEVHDLSGLPAEARGRAVEERVESLQRSLDLERGPLVRAALFEMGDGEPQRLFLVVHHLVVDVPSWAIVLEDLESAAAAIPLAPGSSTFQEYAKRLFEHAQGPEVREEIGFWLAQGEEVAALPLDFQRGPNVEGAMRTVSAGLDPDATAALLRGPTQVALLAALLETLREWTGGGAQRMEFLSHGRQDLLGLDLTRTVGFLTTMAPVRFDAGDLRGEGLRRAVERQLAAVPDGGRGYGLLRYLRQDPDVRDRLARASWPQVGFNYFGQLDAATRSTRFAPARESTGAWHSPKAHRSVQIGLDASVLGGRMNLVWSYSENLHRRETAQRWAERYRELLLAHLGGAT